MGASLDHILEAPADESIMFRPDEPAESVVDVDDRAVSCDNCCPERGAAEEVAGQRDGRPESGVPVRVPSKSDIRGRSSANAPPT